MCLNYISKNLEKKYKNKLFGWKVFGYNKISKKLQGLYFSVSIEYPYERWLNEKDYRDKDTGLDSNYNYILLNNQEGGRYEKGWHIFLTREDAKSYEPYNKKSIIRKVKFKNPYAYGYQNYLKVVVAKEMLIVKPNKKKRN